MSGKLPSDLCLQVVSVAETLANHHVQFILGHIEPAAVGESVHKFKAVPESFGLLGRKGLVGGGKYGSSKGSL
jgi:hypothetical protein